MLDAAQMTSFIDELIRNGPVWPAIMLMIQLCMGERADAVRRARVKWFEDIEAEALGAPFINIPKVNGKRWLGRCHCLFQSGSRFIRGCTKAL